MPFYTNIASRAKVLIDKYGRTLSILKQSDTLKDTLKPYLGNIETPITEVVKGVFYPIEKMPIDNSIALKTDKLCYIAAKGVVNEPMADDFLQDEGIKYSIVHSEKIKTGDVVLIYILKLRV